MSSGIKAFRERIGLKTQTDLAKILEIKPQNISLWESGEGYPSFLIAKKLLELGATVEELFDFEYEKKHNLYKIDLPQQANDSFSQYLKKRRKRKIAFQTSSERKG